MVPLEMAYEEEFIEKVMMNNKALKHMSDLRKAIKKDDQKAIESILDDLRQLFG